MPLIILIGALDQGLIFAILALGLFVAFRILDLPDLTVDGSFVTGLAICGMFCLQGHYVIGLILSFVGGALAGIFTGILHTKIKIQAILAGILTMTALYSINLKIMNLKPSILFYDQNTIFTFIENRFVINGVDISKTIMLAVIVIIVTGLLLYFLKTQIGLSLRATGDNEIMVRSSSINTDFTKILGFALCNALVGLSGGIYIEYTKQASYTVGVGMLVLSLASIIIGETIFPHKSMLAHLIAVIVGSIIYRLFITFAFQLGLPSSDLKLFSALIVIFAISIPVIQTNYRKMRKRYARN